MHIVGLISLVIYDSDYVFVEKFILKINEIMGDIAGTEGMKPCQHLSQAPYDKSSINVRSKHKHSAWCASNLSTPWGNTYKWMVVLVPEMTTNAIPIAKNG